MRWVPAGVAAAMLVVQPAAANDMMFRYAKGQPEVLAPYDGFAHWQLQARCSGLMKARAEYDKARKRKPDQAAASAAYFEREAIARYIADRGADEAKARAVVAYYEESAQKQFAEGVAKEAGSSGRTPAGVQMSECAAVAAALSPPAGTPPRITLADNAKQRTVCRNEAPAGSRLAKRVCRVVQDSDEDEREAKDNVRRMQELGGCRSYAGC